MVWLYARVPFLGPAGSNSPLETSPTPPPQLLLQIELAKSALDGTRFFDFGR